MKTLIALALLWASPVFAQLETGIEANVGQFDERAEFIARGAGYAAFIDGDGVTLDLAAGEPEQRVAVQMRVLDAEPTAPEPEAALPTRFHILVGRDPGGWFHDVPLFEAVRLPQVRPGVDLLFRNTAEGLRYDLEVAPGADPRAVRLGFEGADGLELDEDGGLVVVVADTHLVHSAPVAWQVVDGQRQDRAVRFEIEGETVGFAVEDHDPEWPLIIDPVIAARVRLAHPYSSMFRSWRKRATALGGRGSERLTATTVDAAGRVYVAGHTRSINLPISPGAYQSARSGFGDVVVARLAPDLGHAHFITLFGGDADDFAYTLKRHALGDLVIGGCTQSSDLPTDPGVAQPEHTQPGGEDILGCDGFVARLAPEGDAVTWATYLGGADVDIVYDVVIEPSGEVIAVGETGSPGFPVTPEHGVLRTQIGGLRDGFITRLGHGGELRESTLYGGRDYDVLAGAALGADGTIYVTGSTGSRDMPRVNAFQQNLAGVRDILIAGLDSGLQRVEVASYYGGSEYEAGIGLAIDADDRLFITGWTNSPDLLLPDAFQPTLQGNREDGLMVRLAPGGRALEFASLVGGSDSDGLSRASVSGRRFCGVGFSTSPDFPTRVPLQPNLRGHSDAVVACVDGSGLILSSFIGGDETDGAAGVAQHNGALILAGETRGTTFPTTAGSFQPTPDGSTDGFVLRLEPFLMAQNSVRIQRIDHTAKHSRHARIRLARQGGLGGPARVDLYTLDGTARAGFDYGSVRQTVHFAAAQHVAEVLVPLHGTCAQRSLDTFYVALDRPAGVEIIAPDAAAVTLRPADPADCGGLRGPELPAGVMQP